MKHLVNGTEWEPSRAEGVEVKRGSDRLVVCTKAGESTALAIRTPGATYVSYQGRAYRIERAGRARSAHAGPEGGEARAPMPGQIVEVTCKAGQRVKRGDRLMVLEAMKMQQPVAAPCSGTVATVRVKQGDQVADGQVLAVVSPEEGA